MRYFESYEDNFENVLPKNYGLRVLNIGWRLDPFCSFLEEMGYSKIDSVDLDGALGKSPDAKPENCHNRVDNLPELLSEKKNYDLVTINKVIEHFPKDKTIEYLDLIRKIMNPGGLLILSTPNVNILSGIRNRYCDFTHEAGFTDKSLFQVLKEAGFREIKISGERFKMRPRIKNILWNLLRLVWFRTLDLIYLIELGSDRPEILSKNLIAAARS